MEQAGKHLGQDSSGAVLWGSLEIFWDLWGVGSVGFVGAFDNTTSINQCHVPASHHGYVSYVRLYYTNFTFSFLVTGFVVGLLGGSLGSGGEMYDFHTPFLQEISGAAVMWKF